MTFKSLLINSPPHFNHLTYIPSNDPLHPFNRPACNSTITSWILRMPPFIIIKTLSYAHNSTVSLPIMSRVSPFNSPHYSSSNSKSVRNMNSNSGLCKVRSEECVILCPFTCNKNRVHSSSSKQENINPVRNVRELLNLKNKY